VIHSGVWGFASSPIVTEDEIRRITRLAVEVARASAIAKKADVRLAPVPAYHTTTPIRSTRAFADDKQAGAGRRRQGEQGHRVTMSRPRCVGTTGTSRPPKAFIEQKFTIRRASRLGDGRFTARTYPGGG
jgi:hypothetical protein